ADYRNFLHVRMAQQAVLDLAGPHLEPAGLDDIDGAAADNADHAVRIAHAQVSGAEIAVEEGTPRGLRAIPIAAEQVRSTEDDFALGAVRRVDEAAGVGGVGIDEAHRNARERRADHPRAPYPVNWRRQDEATFGHAVAVHQRHPEARVKAFEGRGAQRGG